MRKYISENIALRKFDIKDVSRQTAHIDCLTFFKLVAGADEPLAHGSCGCLAFVSAEIWEEASPMISMALITAYRSNLSDEKSARFLPLRNTDKSSDASRMWAIRALSLMAILRRRFL